MSGEQRGERGGPSALLSGLPVRDANAFAQRKLDAASFPVTEAPTYLATHDRTSPPPDQGVYRRQKGSHPRLQTHAHPCPSKSSPRRSCRHGDDKHHPAALPAARREATRAAKAGAPRCRGGAENRQARPADKSMILSLFFRALFERWKAASEGHRRPTVNLPFLGRCTGCAAVQTHTLSLATAVLLMKTSCHR
ncbi:hypothetical protein EMIHUDRAFT_437814, partial [Emiliania huxleyi CCMP1516]|uniref:DET1- and DDB1-associated protein 1 domain-containing protein n=2 Tax=Emiliania huxleyi TaxID=2903 RepID=A0A0D3IHD5_EMIH1